MTVCSVVSAESLGWWDWSACNLPSDDGCSTECSAVARDVEQTESTRSGGQVTACLWLDWWCDDDVMTFRPCCQLVVYPNSSKRNTSQSLAVFSNSLMLIIKKYFKQVKGVGDFSLYSSGFASMFCGNILMPLPATGSGDIMFSGRLSGHLSVRPFLFNHLLSVHNTYLTRH